MLVEGLGRLAARGVAAPLVAGVLFAASYYSPLPLLDFLAFVPLLVRIDFLAEGARRGSFRSGFVFGFVAFGIGMHFWMATLRFSWLAALLYLGFTVALAVRVGLTVALLTYLRRRTGWAFALLLPVCWIPFEFLQAIGDLRMTGDHVAHSLARHPFLVQFAELVGHYGVGTFLLVVNGLLFDIGWSRARRRRLQAVGALAVLALTVVLYDAWAWSRSSPPGRELRVALVQPNISQETKMLGRLSRAEQWQVLEQATREAAASRPDLIVWPESARPAPLVHWLEEPATYAMPEVQQLARETGVPLLVGVEYARVRSAEDYELFNAALLVRADGTLDPTWAAKRYLVPFVEALPFRGLLGPLVEGRGGEWRWIAGEFRPPPDGALVELGDVRIGIQVCFEELFPELSRDLRNRGAQLQVVITNDAWWGRTAFQRYITDALRLRAIENRTAIVRVANTGISGFVDRWGLYHQQTPLFEPAIEVREVRLSSTRTVYDRIGDAVVLPIFGLLLLGLLRARRAVAARG